MNFAVWVVYVLNQDTISMHPCFLGMFHEDHWLEYNLLTGKICILSGTVAQLQLEDSQTVHASLVREICTGNS